MNSSTSLPSREAVSIDLLLAEVDLSDAPLRDILTIAAAYASNELMTEEEWRATIDYEAAKEMFRDVLVRYHEIWTTGGEGEARQIVDAALEEV